MEENLLWIISPSRRYLAIDWYWNVDHTGFARGDHKAYWFRSLDHRMETNHGSYSPDE